MMQATLDKLYGYLIQYGLSFLSRVPNAKITSDKIVVHKK